MKPTRLSPLRIGALTAGLAICISLISWDYQQPRSGLKTADAADTTPRKTNREKKVHDLDEAIAELEQTDLDAAMGKARLEMEKAFREVDADKIRQQVDEALKQVDFGKVQAELKEALSQLDCAAIQAEIKKAMEEVDLAKINAETEAALAKVDWEKAKEEMSRVKAEMKNLGPEMEKAKAELEKAKTTLKEYRAFVHALDAEGLIEKNGTYSIEHREGELLINNKKAAAAVYEKHQAFLSKHGNFKLSKSADGVQLTDN